MGMFYVSESKFEHQSSRLKKTHDHNIMNKARRLITLKDGRIESDKNH